MAKTAAGLSDRLTRAQEPARGETIFDLLDGRAPRLDAMLASTGWTVGRLRRVAATACSLEPRAAACSAETLLGALLRCAQLDLEPGPLGHCFIAATDTGAATFILGYRGILALARRSPDVAVIDAQTVYEGDDFDLEFGTDGRLRHRPRLDDDRGQARLWYCFARLSNREAIFRVLTRANVEDRRRHSADAESRYWTEDFDAMALKTAVRAAEPYLPLGDATATAIALDGATFNGLDPEPVQDEVPEGQPPPGGQDGDPAAAVAGHGGEADDGPASPPTTPEDVPSFIDGHTVGE